MHDRYRSLTLWETWRYVAWTHCRQWSCDGVGGGHPAWTTYNLARCEGLGDGKAQLEGTMRVLMQVPIGRACSVAAS